MKFYSVKTDGKKLLDHANCVIKLDDSGKWSKDWRCNAYLIKSRIESIEQGVDQGQSPKVKRSLAYKSFSALVDFTVNAIKARKKSHRIARSLKPQ